MDIAISTVASLRKALDDLPDDRIILCQVVAKDGTAWNMPATFIPQVPGGTIAAIILRHVELKTLPKSD